MDAELAEEVAAKFQPGSSSRDPDPQGVNLLWLRTELEKLMTAMDGKTRLEPSDLQFIAFFQEEHEIGKMLRAIAERKCGDALGFLRSLVASKVAETLVLWCIGDLFRQALRGASSYGYRRGSWSRRSNPLSASELAQAAVRNYPREELLQALRAVRRADLGIKSSWKDSRILLEFLVWQIVVGKSPSGEMALGEEPPVPSSES